MKPKEFRKYLNRDGGKCLHCGATEGLVPQHRGNRGMGGSKERDVPSNVIVFCSSFNSLVESSGTAARYAKGYGWKISTYADPLKIPVYDVTAQGWFMMDNGFSRWAV